MLNEPASQLKNRPLPAHVTMLMEREPVESLQDQLRDIVAQVLDIKRVDYYDPDDSNPNREFLLPAGQLRPVAIFEGRLLIDSEAAYNTLDEHLATIDHLPLLRPQKGNPAAPHSVHILYGRINPKPRPWWPNLLLFLATFLSVLFVGAASSGEIEFLIENPLELRHGLPYALGILGILGAHELGHFFAARRHGLQATLPYFIPMPLFLFGTMGAFIQLREPLRNRKVLLDVGAAGPLAGLVVALPILFIGLLTSDVGVPSPGGLQEGNSLFYAAAKLITFGRFLPGGGEDVQLNQLAFAGWAGLLVTGINLLPVGQLDGGHILYSAVGDFARRLYYPFMIAMVALSLYSGAWVLMILLLFLLGRVNAVPLDDITPLDKPRRWVAILSLLILILVFVPNPISTPRRTGRRARNQVEYVQPSSVSAQSQPFDLVF